MRIRTRVRKYKTPLKAAPTPRVMLGVGALLCALFVWVAHTDAPGQRIAAAPDGVGAARVAAGEPASAGQAQRLVYRYSVVPGGVHSRSDLAGAVPSAATSASGAAMPCLRRGLPPRPTTAS